MYGHHPGADKAAGAGGALTQEPQAGAEVEDAAAGSTVAEVGAVAGSVGRARRVSLMVSHGGPAAARVEALEGKVEQNAQLLLAQDGKLEAVLRGLGELLGAHSTRANQHVL